MATGVIFSLKLGKTRKTINFTFHSDASPLFYVQISTSSVKMLNLHANSSFINEGR